jgi:uncharacterized protein YggE
MMTASCPLRVRKVVTNEGLTRTALVVGIALLLILGVNAGLGTVQNLGGRPATSGGLAGILGGTTAATNVALLGANPYTLSTDGRGSVTLSPDEVQITVGEQTQAATAQSASDANAKVINAIISQLNSIGVANSSISTSSFSIFPLYNYSKAGSQTVYAYQAQHSLQVTVQSANLNLLGFKVSQIIDTAVGGGANQVSQVYFTLSDPLMKQTDNQALQLAIQDASSRAQLMASALNIKLSGVSSVSSTTLSSPVGKYVSTPQAGAGAGGAVSTSVIPGNFTVTASVQVAYEIQ